MHAKLQDVLRAFAELLAIFLMGSFGRPVRQDQAYVSDATSEQKFSAHVVVKALGPLQHSAGSISRHVPDSVSIVVHAVLLSKVALVCVDVARGRIICARYSVCGSGRGSEHGSRPL